MVKSYSWKNLVVGFVTLAAAVPWVPTSYVVGRWQSSPDIAEVVGEIVGRPGWKAGNSLIILVDEEPGNVDGNYWNVQAFDGG